MTACSAGLSYVVLVVALCGDKNVEFLKGWDDSTASADTASFGINSCCLRPVQWLRVLLSLQCFVDHVFDLSRRPQTHALCNNLTIFENLDCRNAGNTILSSELLIFIDVNPIETDFI